MDSGSNCPADAGCRLGIVLDRHIDPFRLYAEPRMKCDSLRWKQPHRRANTHQMGAERIQAIDKGCPANLGDAPRQFVHIVDDQVRRSCCRAMARLFRRCGIASRVSPNVHSLTIGLYGDVHRVVDALIKRKALYGLVLGRSTGCAPEAHRYRGSCLCSPVGPSKLGNLWPS